MSVEDQLKRAFRAALGSKTEGDAVFGLAVSGGGDSVAMLRLGLDLLGPTRLRVATVDHNLRAESAAEAAWVAKLCATHGIPHETLSAFQWDGTGNLMAAARASRQEQLSTWAAGHALHSVWQGHTADDQAETLLMNLQRGSGVDGLAAMSVEPVMHGTQWLRPLLQIKRQDLRDYLTALGQDWIDDPSNLDDRFLRVRTRKLLAELELDVTDLTKTTQLMRDAKAVLEDAARGLSDHSLSHIGAGAFELNLPAFMSARLDTRRRLLAALIRHLGCAAYRPSLAEIDRLLAWMSGGDAQGVTLSGVHLRRSRGNIRLYRELAAVTGRVPLTAGAWENWGIEGPNMAGVQIGALGETGYSSHPARKNAQLPRFALMAAPALWKGDILVSAPLLEPDSAWAATFRTKIDF